jgi:hypothetical protein
MAAAAVAAAVAALSVDFFLAFWRLLADAAPAPVKPWSSSSFSCAASLSPGSCDAEPVRLGEPILADEDHSRCRLRRSEGDSGEDERSGESRPEEEKKPFPAGLASGLSG